MNSNETTYLVAGHKKWNRDHFDKIVSRYPGHWLFVDQKSQLTDEYLHEINPRYIFFLHWSYIVPETIFKKYECVCFHMTDVPYGRGGSPLQNLIIRGHQKTMLTTLRMSEKLDEGPVYLKKELILSGSAEEIYMRASRLSCRIIEELIAKNIKPVPQQGEPVLFKRRTPTESRIPRGLDLDALHDFIRMLDADGYPPPYMDVGGYRLKFSRSARYHGNIKADVTIEKIIENGDGK